MMKDLLVIGPLLLAGCGSSPIKYKPTEMEINSAISLAEEITWSQHENWRPDGFSVNEKYISWEFGVISRNSSWATSVGNTGLAVGGGTSTHRNAGNRMYYRYIDKVQLYSWKRKFKQWYAVAIIEKSGAHKFILRTRSLEDAELFTSAITSIVDFYKVKN